ncbi:pseudouridine-5'-phosphate glycosidase [Streptomyces sp. NBC_00094]|uniref:pseudouridine-5'-phosphate glycosidase n=1 Tax=Streptomyces sp. NBC_00094 TaxID=2903620 RepID=UPI002258DCC3|nr:pseudouridine-5'-phosphate glycosidase [Streptomyces sp. NBC_00094]MCX5390034.1 pseudouridine-5'-phosphate glycosidase [Streptomyces sp. NBC_00094]
MSTQVSEEVREALHEGRPVVALESTIIAHGLPRPRNLAVALELEELVRAGGAVPATVAVIDGTARVGLDRTALTRIAEDTAVRKLGHRDLAPALATGATGATTVSATAWLANAAGIRVFATGGLGGVHREWSETQDESADLRLLARVGITVVCAGVKSILDVPATLQRLETLGVTVLGYGTEYFPGFYLSSSGEPVDWTLRTPEEVAGVIRAQDTLGGPRSALVVANPVPEREQLDPVLHDRILAQGLAAAKEKAITGQAVTPFLLEYLTVHTEGASLEANLAAVRGNVRLAARIAGAYGAGAPGPEGSGSDASGPERSGAEGSGAERSGAGAPGAAGR